MEVIRRFAPEVRFHPDEPAFPTKVEWYLARTRMRFHQKIGPDKPILEGGEVSLLSLVDQAHGGNYSGRGRHRTEFFLEIDGTKSQIAETRQGKLSEAKCYVHVRDAPGQATLTDAQYWFFSPYNPFGPGHEGDWEHVTVRYSATPEIVGVFFASHAKESVWLTPGEFDLNARGGPVVYCALGSHANYATSGVQNRGQWYTIEVPPNDHTAEGGAIWHTSNDVVVIGERNSVQPGQEWAKYTGHWGEIGAPVTSTLIVTSGPYGPAFQPWWDDDDTGAGQLPKLASRQIRCVKRDGDGDTVAVGGDSFRVSVAEAIEEMQLGDRRYWVADGDGGKTAVGILRAPSGKYLRSFADKITANNLDDLPVCE